MRGSHQRSSASWTSSNCSRPRDHGEDHVAAVEDVERLLPADLLHDPRVRRVRALEEGLLGDDRSRVDEPRAYVRPTCGSDSGRRCGTSPCRTRGRRDRRSAACRVLDHAVDELRVPDLVLDLRRQRELPRPRVGARRIQSRSRSTPMSSESVHLDELDEPRDTRRASSRRFPPAARLDVVEELLRARIHGLASLPNGR